MKIALQIRCICALLIVAVVVVFIQTLAFPFVALDDPILITQNPYVLGGITAEGLIWAFTTTEHAHHAMPISWLSLMLDSQLYGKWASGFHLTNLLLHVCNTLLLFGLIRRMTSATWRSALVAGLFALHPLAVESVAWVTCRNYVLSTWWMLVVLWSYVEFAKRGGIYRYLLVVLFLVLGLMAKPSLVTLPLALLLLDYWPLERIRFVRPGEDKVTITNHRQFPARSMGSVLIEKIPLLAISAATAVLTYFTSPSGHSGGGEPIAFYLRAANAAVSYVFYIGKILWPSNLAPMYQHPYMEGGTPWQTWQIAGSVVLLVATTVLVLWLLRHRYLVTGWFWFLGGLVPYIGIVQAGNQGMADRYTYGPSIGLFIIIAWGSVAIARLLRQAHVLASRVVGVIVAMAIVAYGVISSNQTRLWGDSQVIIERTINVSPNYPFLYANLGVLFEKRGGLGDMDRAIKNYRKALEVRSDLVPAHFDLGRALLIKQNVKEGLRHILLALLYDPMHVPAYALSGNVYLSLGQLDKAEALLGKALELEPNHIEARVNLGRLVGRMGRIDDAISHLRRALELSPQHEEAHYNLAVALQSQGVSGEAIDHYRQVLALNPNRAGAHNNLGVMLGGEAAIEHYQKAVSIAPDYFEARLNLANALAEQGKFDEAIRLGRKAVQLTEQGNPQALKVLATVYASAGQFEDAVTAARQGLELARQQKNAGLEKRLAEQLARYMQVKPYMDVSGEAQPRHENMVD